MSRFHQVIKLSRDLLHQIGKPPSQTSEQKPVPVFAQGWCFAKIFMFFVIGSVIGTYYEQILYFCQTLVWESRRGVIYGPFSPVYGVGFAAYVLVLGEGNETRPWYKTYLYAALLGGAVEYLLSWFQEVFFHTKSWDYSTLFLNIHGRTTIPFMLFWGVGGLVFMRLLYPVLSRLIEQIPYAIARFAYPALLIFLCLDLLVSAAAVIRQGARREGLAPITMIGVWCDRVYPDEYLEKVFPNMVFESSSDDTPVFPHDAPVSK